MMGVKLNWFSLGETALVFKYTYSEKYQPRFLEGDKSSLSNLMKNCWSFDAVPKSFAGFNLGFAQITLTTCKNQNTKKGLKPTFQA